MRSARPRGAVLTAATGTLLLTRTGEEGGVDVIRTSGSDVGRVLETFDLPHASFVAAGPAPGTFFVLASSAEGGILVTLLRDGSGLREVGRIATGGADPCHLAVLDDRTVAVANYTGGSIAIVGLGTDGVPARCEVLPLTGGGPDPARQEGAHPHFVWVDPDAADDATTAAIVVDLGADRLRSVRASAAGWVVDDLAVLHPGAGPRHAVSVSGRFVVVDELSGEVTALSLHAPEERHSVASSGLPGAGPVYPGDIVALPGAVAVANRGRDSVAIVELSDEGRLAPRHEWSTGGEWPHQLGWDGERIIVVELRGGRLVRLDPSDGSVDVVLEGLTMPSWAVDLVIEE
jgi:6-phosphogluconolactonase (cycloisomerase 2 family)